MNERIRKLAEQAGYAPLKPRTFADDLQEIFLQKFAELIAAAEREACAVICDAEADEFGGMSDGFYAAKNCAEAIRARGGE